MRRTVFALALLAFAGGAAPDARAACDGPERIVRAIDTRGPVTTERARVVVCGRVVRRTVLRRTTRTRTSPAEPMRGTQLLDASARAGRVAVAVAHFVPWRVPRVVVTLRSLRTGRLLLVRRSRQTTPTAATLMSIGGTVLWRLDERTWLRRVDGRVVRLPSDWQDIALEDDRTLRWRHDGRFLQYLDLDPIPVSDGCPRRSRFRTNVATSSVLVSRADYADSPDDLYERFTVRACLRGSGRDMIIGGGAHQLFFGGYADAPVAVDGAYVLMTHTDGDKYRWDPPAVSTVHAGDGRRPRRATLLSGCSDIPERCGLALRLPLATEPAVVTAHGAPAWLRDGVLYAIDAGQEVIELDRGAITNLLAEGDVVRWTRDGVEHSAAL